MGSDLESLSLDELAQLKPAWEAEQKLAEDEAKAAEKLPDENGFTQDDLYRLSTSDFNKVSANPKVWRPVKLPDGKVIVVRKT
jgi:hypothetical protein